MDIENHLDMGQGQVKPRFGFHSISYPKKKICLQKNCLLLWDSRLLVSKFHNGPKKGLFISMQPFSSIQQKNRIHCFETGGYTNSWCSGPLAKWMSGKQPLYTDACDPFVQLIADPLVSLLVGYR
jgi:hypothetical protein